MEFINVLHTLILGPIELLFDVIYSISSEILHSPGLSIIILSLLINILVLPLYIKADAMQQEEKNLSLRMKPRIDQIRKTFSGDERFMILQSYYRQNHYKPYYALKGSLSLLLQIPFFMAAYNYLSGLQAIRGVGFGPIQDLSRPDGLIQIAGLTLNLLPILMTVINIVSGAIYTRGMPVKTKVQLYGMAILFLVILYDSPAGLVFYWTLNNVFSLGKNIVNKLRNPKKCVAVGLSVAGILLAAFFLFNASALETKRRIWGLAVSLGLQIPVLYLLIHKKNRSGEKKGHKDSKVGRTVFFLSCITMTVVTGLFIPSAVIGSSPAEFVEAAFYHSPLNYVFQSFLLAAGTFMIWCVVFYLLAPDSQKDTFSLVAAIVTAAALVDYMFFGTAYGNMSSLLQYEQVNLPISLEQKMINLGILLVIAFLIRIIWKKKREMVRILCVAECMAIVGISAGNIIMINRQIPEIERVAAQIKNEDNRIIHLDQKGKNVVVFMLDRAVGALLPYLFQEHSELQDQFNGFTWYPNTLSYGGHTNVGAPPLFGGYEYLPEKMDQRADELLRNKHNEALKVMPVNFLNAGYEVTVCDAPYANYQWIPDLSIYDDYPEIRTYNTEEMMGMENRETAETYRHIRNRNLFCYSVFRVSPLLIQAELYDFGNYNEADMTASLIQHVDTLSQAQGIDVSFKKSFQVLKKLPEITEICAEGKNKFLMINNNTAHNVTMLQEPEYEPQIHIDNTEYDTENRIRYAMDGRELILTNYNQVQHYQINMAAFLQIGKWLNYLREQKVYDNTRIIFVSDHGWTFEFPEMQIERLGIEITFYNPLLLVKDFNSRGELKINYDFMTNADTPTLAFEDVILSPINPFSQCPITNEEKNKEEQHICEADWHIDTEGKVFQDKQYYVVKNRDVLNSDNWDILQ